MAEHLPPPDRRVRSLLDSGRFGAASTVFDELIGAMPHTVDERWDPAIVLVHRALLAWRLERIPLALELAADGWTDLDTDRTSGVAAAHTASMLGYLLETIGHRTPALDLLTLSVRLARDVGDAPTLAHCLTREGGALISRALRSDDNDQLNQARNLFDEALRLADPGSVRRSALAGSARTLAGLGEGCTAERLGAEALAQSHAADDWFTRSMANSALAAVQRTRGNLPRARTLASRALAAAECVRDTMLVMRFSMTLSAVCAELADPVGEAAALRRTVAASQSTMELLQEGLGQALEQRRVAVQAQRMAEAAQDAASRDPLTGLRNRFGMEQLAPEFLSGGGNTGESWLLLIDVDWFKEVNDHAGHTAGDAALQEIAQLLRRECRSTDEICRWAGDEFVILLAETTEPGEPIAPGPLVAERIRSAVDTHDWGLVLGWDTWSPTVSIGVAHGTGPLDELFAAADVALYRTKNAGRNRVSVHDENAFAEGAH